MVDVCFRYSDDSQGIRCEDITSIQQHYSSEYSTFSGDDLLNFQFDIAKTFYLHSESSNFVVSAKNLKSVEITKK